MTRAGRFGLKIPDFCRASRPAVWRWHAVLVSAAVLFATAGCCQEKLDERATRLRGFKLYVGMPEGELLSLLGQPDRRRSSTSPPFVGLDRFVPFKTYQLVYFDLSQKHRLQSQFLSMEDMSQLVLLLAEFEEGRLIHWERRANVGGSAGRQEAEERLARLTSPQLEEGMSSQQVRWYLGKPDYVWMKRTTSIFGETIKEQLFYGYSAQTRPDVSRPRPTLPRDYDYDWKKAYTAKAARESARILCFEEDSLIWLSSESDEPASLPEDAGPDASTGHPARNGPGNMSP